MPRNGSGTYALPAGNPVTSGTLIEASWANTTLSDIASAVTDSLARSGEGGMTGPLRAADGTVSTPSVSFVSETATGFYRAGATDVRFAMAGVDVATLTTAGVTVGSTKVLALPDGTAAAPALTNTGDTNTGVFFPDADTVAVSTGGTERLRVDASGNLGLGVTPSGWNAGKVMQFDTGGAFVFSDSLQFITGVNAYYQSGWKYTGTGAATKYETTVGQHRWFTAPSGTAGNAISFTQAMTLDASGNLGVGTTPVYGARLSVSGTGSSSVPTNLADLSGSLVLVSSQKANIGYGGVGYQDSGGGGAAVVFNRGGSYDTNILFLTNPSGNATAGAMIERARITSGGDVCVNTTAAVLSAKFSVETAGGRGYGFNDTSGTAGTKACIFGSFGVEVGNISVTTSATAYNTSSDYRLKENIQPMTGGLAKVAQLKPCTYTWKANGTAGQGFIAHELAEVVPDAVTGEKDAVNEDGSIKAQGIDTSYLVATLTAALQEAHALIKSLEQRVAALEAQS